MCMSISVYLKTCWWCGCQKLPLSCLVIHLLGDPESVFLLKIHLFTCAGVVAWRAWITVPVARLLLIQTFYINGVQANYCLLCYGLLVFYYATHYSTFYASSVLLSVTVKDCLKKGKCIKHFSLPHSPEPSSTAEFITDKKILVCHTKNGQLFVVR